MKDSFSWLTPKQAGELAGYSARHIQSMITSGKLTANKEDGKYYIDKSEFFRMFPKAFKKEQEGNSSLHLAEKQRLEMENELLKEITFAKDKEIAFLRNQVESVSIEKGKMLDVIVSNTRLLEYKKDQKQDKEKPSIWSKIFKQKKE